MARRLLIASYYFPPLGGSGALRPYHLARALAARGWEVCVVTTTPWTDTRVDRALIDGLPPSVQVRELPGRDLYHLRRAVAGGSGAAGARGRHAGGRARRLASRLARA